MPPWHSPLSLPWLVKAQREEAKLGPLPRTLHSCTSPPRSALRRQRRELLEASFGVARVAHVRTISQTHCLAKEVSGGFTLTEGTLSVGSWALSTSPSFPWRSAWERVGLKPGYTPVTTPRAQKKAHLLLMCPPERQRFRSHVCLLELELIGRVSQHQRAGAHSSASSFTVGPDLGPKPLPRHPQPPLLG